MWTALTVLMWVITVALIIVLLFGVVIPLILSVWVRYEDAYQQRVLNKDLNKISTKRLRSIVEKREAGELPEPTIFDTLPMGLRKK